MSNRPHSRFAILLMVVATHGTGAPTPQGEPPSPEIVAKLIVQLSAADFRSRQQASDQLEKLGSPVLPGLRKAANANAELEVKRRIEVVMGRIEKSLLNLEEKRWEDLDAPRRGVKDRIVKILAKTPTLNDRQIATAIYLVAAGRVPTDEEVARAEKQFAGHDGRPACILQFTRSLVQTTVFNSEFADVNSRLFVIQKELAAEGEFAKVQARILQLEYQKKVISIGTWLDKAVKNDEQLVDAASLLALSRFPNAYEKKGLLDHLKAVQPRSVPAENIVFSRVYSYEFWTLP